MFILQICPEILYLLLCAERHGFGVRKGDMEMEEIKGMRE
jgi:hypothetical protein